MQTEDRRNGIGTITERAWLAHQHVRLNGMDMHFTRQNKTRASTRTTHFW
jgi:hypothetical protein